MVKSKKHIFTVVGLFVLVVTLILLSPQRSYAPPGAAPPLNVNVVNPETAPVPTHDVDNPAFQSVGDSVFCNIQENNESCFGVKELPAGKRLVIEHLGARVSLPEGQHGEVAFTIHASALAEGVIAGLQYDVPLAFAVNLNSNDHYQGMHPVRLYPIPGTAVQIDFRRDSDQDSALAVINFSGYLVDVPE